MTANRFAETVPDVIGSLASLFGTGSILDLMASIRHDIRMTKRRHAKLTDQLRQAIDDCGLTRYEIAKQTRIDRERPG